MPTITAIAPGRWLDTAPAASYLRMRADGCPAGGITDAGRTNAEQVEMYRLYLAGKLKATAARPGTSKHETGRALDLDGATLAWVRAYGADYGWIRDQVRNEPWHLEYVASRDTHTSAPAQEDDMTPEQDNLLRHVVAMLGEVPARTATAVAATPVNRVPGQPSTWLQDTVDGTTAALATREIVGQLTSSGGTTGISTADLARIAKTVADEQARRQAS